MLDHVNELNKAKTADKVSKFDIELLDATLAILMDLKIKPKHRFLCGIVLSSHEFEPFEQIKSFLPKFLIKMTHTEMQLAAYQATNSYIETEDFITKMIDIKGTTDFLKEFLIPTNKKVYINS